MAQLPIGAVAGIAIGAGLGALLLFVITIWWCCWCRRRARARRSVPAATSQQYMCCSIDIISMAGQCTNTNHDYLVVLMQKW
jgi:hypothetical protein